MILPVADLGVCIWADHVWAGGGICKTLVDRLAGLVYTLNLFLRCVVHPALTDIELIRLFEAVEGMEDEDKAVIKRLIDAFIAMKQIQKLAR